MEGAAWMHWGAVETTETGLETSTEGGGQHINTSHGLEDHSDGKVSGHPSETEISTSDVGLSSHNMNSYNSSALSQDLSSAAPWRTAACMTPIYCTDTETGCPSLLPECKEEVPPERQERSPSLAQVKPTEPLQMKQEQEERSLIFVQVALAPSQIKKEQQEELLQTPEEAAWSSLTLLAEKSEYDGENSEAEPQASTSTEHMKTQAGVEHCGTSQPTIDDDQLLSSRSSESDNTEDSDDWPSRCSDSDAEGNLEVNEERMNRKFDLTFKLAVVKYAEQTSGRAAATQYNVDPRRVREWKKLKSEMTSQTNAGGKRARLPGGGRKKVSEEMETTLCQWIRHKHDQNIRVSQKMIRAKAKELHAAASDKRDGEVFGSTQGWLVRFLQRNKLSLRMRTQKDTPMQGRLEPPQIKNEQHEELIQSQEEAPGSPLTLRAVKSEDDDVESAEAEPLASTSTEHTETQADVENCGPSQPTSDDRLRSSRCFESDTEGNWEVNKERMNNKYDLTFKLAVVKYAEQTSGEAAARQFDVDPKRVRDWKKQKSEITSRAGSRRARLPGGGRKKVSEEMETNLCQWIRHRRDRNIPVSRKMIQVKAQELHAAASDKRDGEVFRSTDGWLAKFLRRNNLDLSMRTPAQKDAPMQGRLEPPQIKEEQQEEAVEHRGTSQPTSDDQLLSSHCSESDITADSDNHWPSHCSESEGNFEANMDVNEENSSQERDKNVTLRRKFDLTFKLAVVKYAEQTSGGAAARHFNVDPRRVREWKKQKSRMTFQANAGGKRARLPGGGRKKASG